VVEHIGRVVLGLDLRESTVGVVAVGLSNADVVVGVEEVDVDAVPMSITMLCRASRPA